jgi:hypothetical protein
MENINEKAKKLNLEKGYYLLLMAILDLPVKEVQNTVKEG